MVNYKFKLDNSCVIKGRQDLLIKFNCPYPEKLLQDKSLVGLKGKELENALKKPFFVLRNLLVTVEYESDSYNFIIPKGYSWNGANVPFFAWLTIGQQKDPRFKLASCIHDYLCENKEVIGNNRYLSTLIFETLCEYFGRFNAFKRWAMFHSVDNWQKFQGWKKCK